VLWQEDSTSCTGELRSNTGRETTLVKVLMQDDEEDRMITHALLIRDGHCRLKHFQRLLSRRARLRHNFENENV
jgi:hypothetical protein